MSFSFGTPSSSSASADNATTTAPASGGLFGNVSGGAPKFSFAKVGGSSGSDANTNTTPSNNTGFLFAQKPAGNIFGGDGSSNTNSTPTAGASTTPSIGGLFGEGNTTPATSTPAASSSEASGGGSSGAFAAAIAAAKPASGGLFGGGPSSTGASSGASQSQSTTTETAKPSLFANTGTSLFGNKAGIASATSAQSTAPATAEATPPKSLFALPSTTPAGAPPGDTSQPTSTTATSASALFGGAAAKPTTPTTSTPAAPSGLFSGAQAGGGSFAGNMFGNKAATTTEKPAASLFGAAAGSAPSSSSPAAGATKATTGSASSLFGAKPAATTTPETSTATSGGFLSGNAKSAAETPGATTTSTSGGLFGKPATPTSTAGQLFGAKSTADTANKDENQSKEEPKPATQNSAASALGASTAGPTSQMARLKNKTMEDIVTRWASDLTKYQKEFKEQATTVSSWDRSLVDNGEKIQKLYLDTFEAERASHEIERQLAAVESQQEELEAWLNRYESEIQDMFAKQVGPGEQLAGPDQERERTYKLAEKLTQHLDEKSRDLSKMVKEINDISGTLSKGAKTEDPLSQIVRVLNGHLTQLQWIDVNASALQAKVTAAQKSSSSLSSHYAGPESDAAEGFYRSYYGRR